MINTQLKGFVPDMHCRIKGTRLSRWSEVGAAAAWLELFPQDSTPSSHRLTSWMKTAKKKRRGASAPGEVQTAAEANQCLNYREPDTEARARGAETTAKQT